MEPVIRINQEPNPQGEQKPWINHQAVHKEQDCGGSDKEDLRVQWRASDQGSDLQDNPGFRWNIVDAKCL